MCNSQVCDIPFTNIVTTLEKDITAWVSTCLIVKSTFYPLCSNRELTIRVNTKAKGRDVLFNRTLNLVVKGIDCALISHYTTNRMELGIPAISGCFCTFEVKATILNREASFCFITCAPTIELDCACITVFEFREINLCVDDGFCICSQEHCHKSNESK